jgi:hypothetical protein
MTMTTLVMVVMIDWPETLVGPPRNPDQTATLTLTLLMF